MFTDVLTKILGAQALKDLSLFVASLETMFGGFRERADQTYQLLKEPGTAFIVVAVPERDALREAAYFVERLGPERMPLAGLVLNRVHTSPANGLSVGRAVAAAEELESAGDQPIAAAVLAGACRADGAGHPGRTPREAVQLRTSGRARW